MSDGMAADAEREFKIHEREIARLRAAAAADSGVVAAARALVEHWDRAAFYTGDFVAENRERLEALYAAVHARTEGDGTGEQG